MARTISPSNNQVQDVYSSGGFAAGDYVFLTSTGFEKCQASGSFPLKANATQLFGNAYPIGMGIVNLTDYLLGPSQAGGTYTGPAINSGDANVADTTVTSFYGWATTARLSGGNIVVCGVSGSTVYANIYNSTATTLITTASVNFSSSINFLRVIPDNSNGLVVLVSDTNPYARFAYLANTTGNTFQFSSSLLISSALSNAVQYGYCAISTQGIVSLAGYNLSTSYPIIMKATYLPGSASTPTLLTSSQGSDFLYGTEMAGCVMNMPVFFPASGYTSPRFGFIYQDSGSSNAHRLGLDTNSTGNASFSSTASANPGNRYTLGNSAVLCRNGAFSNQCMMAPTATGSSIYILMAAFNTNLALNSMAYSAAINVASTVVSYSDLNLFTISDPSVTGCSLLLTYTRNNGSGGTFKCARIISSADIASGGSPSVGSEIILNSGTETSSYAYSVSQINYDIFGNGVFGSNFVSGSSVSFAAKAGASITTPQPFAYANSLSPASTGPCVGVALTSASAGGIGKILTRGTAQVRSGLPSAPVALSFNHANYAPGGIKGTVTGRTVTFEGIDG